MIIWIIFGVIYLVIAVCMIRNFSYCCCMTYGCYEYSFLSVMAGLFFPVYILLKLIGEIIE